MDNWVYKSRASSAVVCTVVVDIVVMDIVVVDIAVIDVVNEYNNSYYSNIHNHIMRRMMMWWYRHCYYYLCIAQYPRLLQDKAYLQIIGSIGVYRFSWS